MNVIQQITRDNLYQQARRICYENELPPEYFNNVLLEVTQREFMRAIGPFLNLKGRITAMCVNLAICPDGVVRCYSPEQQAVLDTCDENIAHIAKQLGEAMGTDLMIGSAA